MQPATLIVTFVEIRGLLVIIGNLMWTVIDVT